MKRLLLISILLLLGCSRENELPVLSVTGDFAQVAADQTPAPPAAEQVFVSGETLVVTATYDCTVVFARPTGELIRYNLEDLLIEGKPASCDLTSGAIFYVDPRSAWKDGAALNLRIRPRTVEISPEDSQLLGELLQKGAVETVETSVIGYESGQVITGEGNFTMPVEFAPPPKRPITVFLYSGTDDVMAVVDSLNAAWYINHAREYGKEFNIELYPSYGH